MSFHLQQLHNPPSVGSLRDADTDFHGTRVFVRDSHAFPTGDSAIRVAVQLYRLVKERRRVSRWIWRRRVSKR